MLNQVYKLLNDLKTAGADGASVTFTLGPDDPPQLDVEMRSYVDGGERECVVSHRFTGAELLILPLDGGRMLDNIAKKLPTS